MKKHFLPLLLCFHIAAAQSDDAQVKENIYKLDSAFWRAYNTCDVSIFRNFLADDLEFYHDRGGITIGGDSLAASLKRNLCSKPGYHLRREPLPATIKINVLKKNDSVYGAIIEGEHVFYVTMDGKPEYEDGQANFLSLWLRGNEGWKMSRVLSYNHHEPDYINKRTQVSVSESDLAKLRGRYKSEKFGVMEVVVEGDHLLLKAGGTNYKLLPQTSTSFFTTGRDLVFDFKLEGDNKAHNFTVTEKGNLADTLLRLE